MNLKGVLNTQLGKPGIAIQSGTMLSLSLLNESRLEISLWLTAGPIHSADDINIYVLV